MPPIEVGSAVVIAATVVENHALFDQGRKLGWWVPLWSSQLTPLGAGSLFLLVPPPPGWIKVNVDGSLLPSRRVGLSIVVCSEDGAVLVAAGFAWLHWDPCRVEIEAVVAIRRIVSPALLEARGVIVEGDATNVLDFCTLSARNSARPSSLLPNVDLSFLSEFTTVRFQHVWQGANGGG
ncbi:hypothetical protein KSP40_PGU022217 [Platanthera guangdongensis]|uniref:RNase H type-1 domain-containing protein n=1 Tax=Platanthera guangdongensis TaxID=2320717 RepID=A0ABR2N1J1_9ASPA